MKASVILLNRDMGTAHRPTIVQTWLGVKVGVSRYNPKYNCHTIEMTMEDYDKNAKSLMAAAHIALRRWEPHFVVEDLPKPVKDFSDGYNAGMDHKEVTQRVSRAFRSGHEYAILEAFAVSRYATEEVLRPLHDYPAHRDAVARASSPLTEFEEGYYIGISGSNLPETASAAMNDGLYYGRKEAGHTPLMSHEERSELFKNDQVGQSEVLADVAETGSAWNEITAKTHHLTLKKIAREEGVDISNCITPQEKVDAILKNREESAAVERSISRGNVIYSQEGAIVGSTKTGIIPITDEQVRKEIMSTLQTA